MCLAPLRERAEAAAIRADVCVVDVAVDDVADEITHGAFAQAVRSRANVLELGVSHTEQQLDLFFVERACFARFLDDGAYA